MVCTPAFPTRLWCVMELFIFMQLGGAPEKVVMILPDGITKQDVLDQWDDFDVDNTQCSRKQDKIDLAKIMTSALCTRQNFNETMRNYVHQIARAPMKSTGPG